ncbi:EF-P lysine aminoacylase EpmA [Methylophaga thiooxydans]|uniref:tRNA synthetase class II (D, K and N) subfamily n=1 Tax=Methylophaga thiooxydans DMS010 TaxID=637616 RepID=C0N767_9GAMM|nr:EF-P lysine aminoacylase EpmA [Methylophaga thiooxydans]EEF79493.1 tRNA synthetase class II (D, K and N) subfamily [Methylophaga thiooxydans DMS010]
MSSINWQPSSELEILKRRAQLLADVRLFFAERNVMEVQTPVLSQAAPTATYLDSFSTDYAPTGQHYYLQTSPEFAMKRLLAAGSGDIYQIAPVFRNGELGRLHSPEFTMLEWYRPALDYVGLMYEVDALLQQLAGFPAAVKISYQQLYIDTLQCDPLLAETKTLKSLAFKHIPSLPDNWETDHDGWLELLMSEVIEPQLLNYHAPVIVFDFPASQAQLANVYQNPNQQKVAARFEVYAGGLELANGYDECLDPVELKQRFERDNQLRSSQNKTVMPIDERLLAAQEAGLPACTGVAMGLDRLLMLISGKTQLSEVLSFGFEHS